MNALESIRPHGMNHAAYRCRDAAQTCWFYEDVLGLRLATALVLEEVPSIGTSRSS